MLCDDCKKNPASIHFASVSNGQKVEMHLCEECAAKKGIQMLSNLNLTIPNVLGNIIGHLYSGQPALSPSEQAGTHCPGCGLSFTDVRQTGKLGCAQCYKVFQEELEATLRRVQGNVQHTGKIPARSGKKVLLRRQIENLKTQLQESVINEKYEKAAEIRDSIKELERQQEK